MRRRLAVIGISAAVLAAGLAGCSRLPVSDALSYGVLASQDGQWAEAVLRWKKALAENPNSAAAHNNLAVAYEKEGSRREAAAEYEAARRIDPENTYIAANFARFERAADVVPPESFPVQAPEDEKLPRRVTRVSFLPPAAPAVDIGRYSEILVTNFRHDMPPPDFELDAWLADSLMSRLQRLVKGTVSRQTVPWNGPARVDDPEFWREAAAGRDATVFLTGTVRFTGQTEKALRRSAFPKDAPFRLENRGLVERTRFEAVIEIVLIPASTGAPAFRETFEESRVYDVAGESAEIGFAGVFDRILLRFFRSLLGNQSVQSRYLLSR